MVRFLSVFFFLNLLFVSCSKGGEEQRLYEGPLEKIAVAELESPYVLNRIPGIVVAGNDAVLCYYEARKSASDWAEIDLLCKRSTDYGDTWTSCILASSTAEHETLNNPVMIAGRGNDVFFLYCEDYMINGGKLKLLKSSDAGLSWSEPEDISYATQSKDHDVFAIGPGHGIYKNGALSIPCWYVPKGEGASITAHSPSKIAVLFSNDYGKIWCISDDIPLADDIVSPSEASLCACSDGTLYNNIRTTRSGYRAVSRAIKFEEWEKAELDKNLSDPTCFASVVAFDISMYDYNGGGV